MRFKKQITATCLVLIQFTGAAHGQPGFLLNTDKTIPAAVARASDHVYKLTSQAGRLNRVILMSESGQVKQAQDQFVGDDNWWKKTQLNFCIENKLDICSIFDQMGEGSAFALNNPNSMYTNLHNFYEVISANYSLDLVATPNTILKRNLHRPLLFALNDQNGKSILNKSKMDFGTLEFFNPSPFLLGANVSMMNSALGRVSDIVRVHLTNTSASPLQFAKASSELGDDVYLVGFPMATSNRFVVGGMDSDGNSLRISKGKIISFAEWKRRTGNNFGTQAETLLQDNIIFFDADCEHGNSGGPLLNSSGEVIGIMMALYQDNQKGIPYRICGALGILDETKLAALWKSQGQ